MDEINRPLSAQSLAQMPKDKRDEYESTHDMEREKKLMPKVFDKRPTWKRHTI